MSPDCPSPSSDLQSSTSLKEESNPPIIPPEGDRDDPKSPKPILNKIQQERFDRFWKPWPNKKSKGKAEKAWKKLNPSEQLLATMLATIERAKTSKEWARNEGEYIPHPATWINGKGWLDEYTPAPKRKIPAGERRPAPERESPQPSGPNRFDPEVCHKVKEKLEAIPEDVLEKELQEIIKKLGSQHDLRRMEPETQRETALALYEEKLFEVVLKEQ